MKYFEILFTITPCSEDARDVLSALAGEAGCESFEEVPEGLKAYIQQQFYDQEALEQVLDGFPFESTHITYKVREAEDLDWNEQWEQEGFEPIIVNGRGVTGCSRTIVIHDGRHLPADHPLTSLTKVKATSSITHTSPLTSYIEIDAHLAFGTGNHETTRMICATLMDMELEGKRVLDCGCGTGILGICTLKAGARECVGYDIDEWSADNTRHNAVINQVDDRLQAYCGDATLLDSIDGKFDIVMANINRNILLQDMERFCTVMNSKATLILSGFYQSDCALLESKAQQLELSLSATYNDGDWACMVFERRV